MQEEYSTLSTHSYTPPLDKLLTYTNIQGDDPLPDISYVEQFGIGPEHIPELIRMATDDYLLSDDANNFELAAPLHAVSALAELHAEEAVEPLLTVYDKSVQIGHEWMNETLVDVFVTLGPVALPAMERFLTDPSHQEGAQGYVAETIGRMAMKRPEARAECLAVLTRLLKEYATNSIELNTDLIVGLTEMKAVEAAELIQEALASGRFDESWFGDWEEVQYLLGLKERPPRDDIIDPLSFLSRSAPSTPAQPMTLTSNTPVPKSKKAPPSKKAKAKMAKASKKANRRKKS